MQLNNQSVLSYDGAQQTLTNYPFTTSRDKPFENGVINFYYHICETPTKQFGSAPPSFLAGAAPISHESQKIDLLEIQKQKRRLELRNL